MSKTRNYHITWSEMDGEYVAVCEDFPSLSGVDVHPVTALVYLLTAIKIAENDD